MSHDSNEPPYFCYLSINNLPEFIVQTVLMCLSLLLVGDAFRKFYRMRGSHNKHVTFVYRLLFFWWITYVVSNSYSLVLYQLNDSDSQRYSNEQLSWMSKYYFFVDWINAFTIQWLLLYLPYQWAKQISLLFDSLMSQKESEVEMEHPVTAYQGYQTKIYKTLKFYMFLRLSYLALPVVFLIVDNQAVLFKIMITSLLIDCIVITLSLIFGMVSLKTTRQLKEQLDEQQSKRTFNQYLVFIFANTIRFIFDLKHVINRVFSDDIYVNACPDNQDYSMAMSMTLLVCTCLLTFYLPVFIILRIYNLQEKPEQMCESLIISKADDPQEQQAVGHN